MANEKINSEQEELNNQGFRVDLSKTPKAEAEKILAFIGMCLGSIDPAKTLLHPEIEYVIDLPVEIMQEMADGGAWLQKRKSGELMAQIVHQVGDKKEIYKIPNVVERVVGKGEAVASLALSLEMAAISQKLDEIAKDIEEVKERVVSIEEGQKEDRFGTIIGAEKHINEAICSTVASNRETMLLNALQTLSEGSGVLEQNIKRLMTDFSKIPHSRIGLKDKKYYSKLRKLNEELREYFEMYRLSQELRAYAHVALNDLGALKEVLKQQNAFLKEIDFNKLARAGRAYKIGTKQMDWLINPKKPFNDLFEKYIGFAERHGETVSVTVTGQQLQLALAG